MKVLQQPLGPVQANCYLVMENHHAILIDPADMYPNLEFILKENECTLEAIVLTHAHFDHISGVDKIVDVFHCDVYFFHLKHNLYYFFIMNLIFFKIPI